MKKRFSEEQIIGFLKEADAGLPVVGLSTNTGWVGFSGTTSKGFIHPHCCDYA